MLILEHTLVILLLLVGLLNARPKMPWLAWGTIIGAMALAFVTPVTPIDLPWGWLSALLIPILFWQAARRLTSTYLQLQLWEVALWLVMALGIGGILLLTSELTGAGAFMFGLLTASMVWQATEEENRPTLLGQVGPLALAFLLAEIAPAVEAPGRYAIALFAGAGIGALVGYTAVRTAQRISPGPWQNGLSLGQVYVGYGVAIFFNLSGVAAALLSVAIFVTYGTRRGLWSNGIIRPKPLDSPPLFILAVLALAFFAWQTHVPITPLPFIETGLGLAFIALIVWIGRRMKSKPFLLENSYARIILRVGFLLIPAILLWPRGALLDPLPLVIALIIATLAMTGTSYSLTPLLKMYSWLDEAGAEVKAADRLIHTLRIRDLMERECTTISRETPVVEIARLFTEGRMECLPVVDEENHLEGIVTEHDLFVKEERLPRTDRTYQVVFNEPVIPEQLAEVYSQRGAIYSAADVMTSKVVWVTETATLGQAVRLMVRYGFKCLPVLDNAPESGGKLVGVITRSGIVRLLAKQGPSGIP